ncbi:MAG: hypothetical protein IK081_13190 [Lachnospiraceae bacterium]|nr:hypothetical protein [Lachnospiraceae bacterium]
MTKDFTNTFSPDYFIIELQIPARNFTDEFVHKKSRNPRVMGRTRSGGPRHCADQSEAETEGRTPAPKFSEPNKINILKGGGGTLNFKVTQEVTQRAHGILFSSLLPQLFP